MPDYGIPSTDVKVAGPPAGARSRDELGDGDGPRPAGHGRSASLGRPALPKIAVVAAVIAVVVGGGTVAAFALTGGSGGKAATVAPSKPASTSVEADPANDPAAQQAEAAAARKLVLDRASRAARKASGKHPALAVKGSPLPTTTPSAAAGSGGGGGGDPVPAGQAQQIAKGMMSSFGFGGSGQFGCLVNLWNRESHWNTHAGNNASGAYGIPQAVPGNKMASAGADWRDSAQTQIKWGLGYIKNRYGTPCGAWSHSQASGWY
jgi:hypothetical protein